VCSCWCFAVSAGPGRQDQQEAQHPVRCCLSRRIAIFDKMASLLPDFEYDIFVSYRHNDNLDGWVTEFVQSLEKELRVTVKESLTVYFDKNPAVGLSDVHIVDKSLEGKLKSIIFIPILSQTYCDPKSFAWQHEFCAFNRKAKTDAYGIDVRLGNGNVSSRILPVRIHDLDQRDKSIIEGEIGGVLRSIEFIYKEPSVNRALRADDKKDDNLLKTSYRNQVNKVANAVKEILNGLIPSEQQLAEKPERSERKSRKVALKNPVIALSAIVTAALITFFVFWNSDAPDSPENTILVLPFRTDRGDETHEYFAQGITADIITEIGKAEHLVPLSWHTSFAYINTSKSLREVAEETQARYVLSGGIQRDSGRLRFYVELADPVNNKTVWNARYDKQLHEILDVQKEIAFSVASALDLRLSDSERQNIGKYKTKSFEAYDLFLQAEALSRTIRVDPSVYERCRSLLEEALSIDPNFAEAHTLYAFIIIEVTTFSDLDYHAMSYKAEESIQKAIELRPDLPDNYIIKGGINLYLKWDLEEARKNFERGWAMANKGQSVIDHCMCNYSHYKLVKGDYAGVLGFVDSVRRTDPYYPFAELEKFLAYQGLNNMEGMKAIRATEKPESLLPMYDYMLGDYEKSVKGFATPFLILAHAGSAYYKAGMTEKADSILNHVIRQPAATPHKEMMLAILYGARGEKDNALNWYVRAYENHSYIVLYTRVIPDLKIILDEPKVKEIFGAIGL
jgi:TolB-like protein